MNPPVAARASASTPSLHDRLKDPSLLRDRCYIDGAWVGAPSRPVTKRAGHRRMASTLDVEG